MLRFLPRPSAAGPSFSAALLLGATLAAAGCGSAEDGLLEPEDSYSGYTEAEKEEAMLDSEAAARLAAEKGN